MDNIEEKEIMDGVYDPHGMITGKGKIDALDKIAAEMPKVPHSITGHHAIEAQCYLLAKEGYVPLGAVIAFLQGRYKEHGSKLTVSAVARDIEDGGFYKWQMGEK